MQSESSLRVGSLILTSETRRARDIFLHKKIKSLKTSGKNKLESEI